MKKIILFCLISLFVSSIASAQALYKVREIEEYWPVGEERLYQFVIEDTEVGRLTAIIDEHISKTDTRPESFEIDQRLTLDFSRLELGPSLQIESKLTVDKNGFFLSAELDIAADDRRERVEVVYDQATGAVTSGRGEDLSIKTSLDIKKPAFAFDNYMVHQLEMALAMHDLIPGETFEIPILSPQVGYVTDFEFFVVGKTIAQYGVFTDSVWQVNQQHPGKATIFVDRKHKLVRLFDADRNMTAEIVIDPFESRRGSTKTLTERIDDQVRRFPIYGFYFLVSIIWLVFLGRDSYRLKWAYLLYVMGGVVYPLILITQVPLQEYYGLQILVPAVQAGDPIYIPSLIPALVTGLIQETLKLIPLLIVARSAGSKPIVIISLGAFVGAGFGFIEACHIAGPLFQSRFLTSITMTERIFAVLFQTAAGAMLGYGLARKKTILFWLAAVGLHSLGNYMIVFVQAKVVSVTTLSLILAFYNIAVLAIIFLLQRSFRKSLVKVRKGRR